MFGIKIKNQFLKLYPKTTFGFELSNAAYLGDDVAAIDNGMIFSTKVPLSGGNEILLRYPHLLENEWRFLKNEPCEVWKNGRPVFSGALTIKTSTDGTIRDPSVSVQITINTIAQLKDLKMSDLDMGRINTDNILTVANDSVIHPLNYPFIFYPVINPSFAPNKISQNAWSLDKIELQTTDIDNNISYSTTVLTPHLRLDYIQRKIFEHINFDFVNSWQINDELKLLTQVGYAATHQLLSNEFNEPFFNLNRALSSTTVSAWIGKLCRVFSLVPDINLFARTANFIPFIDVLKRSVKWDWTSFVKRGGELTESNNYPKSLKFKKLGILPDISTMSVKETITKPDFNSEDGLYQNNGIVVYHRKKDVLTDTSKPDIIVQTDNVANISGGMDDIEFDILPLPQSDFFRITEYGKYYSPYVEQPGKLLYKELDTPDHWLFYRGMHSYNGLYSYPIATSESLTFLPIKVMGNTPQYDLTWNGENGLFNRFWKDNLSFLQEKRDYTVKLSLPLDQFLQFSFIDKVRIKNMNFLVKKMRGVLRSEGDNVDLEVNLVTVI